MLLWGANLSLENRTLKHTLTEHHTATSSTGGLRSLAAAAPLFPRPLLIIMAAAFAVVLPFFFLGNPSGHDFEFHLNSWMEVLNQWNQGIIYPRWAALAHYGYGEARFIFYPPASWTLGAALGASLPWKAAPGVYVWLALTLSGGSMFLLARRWLDRRDATFAAALYAANPYYIVIVYWRSAFAELLAGALLPLLLLYVLRSQEERGKVIIPLGLIVAAAWLTNAPAAVMVNYSLALLVVTVAIVLRSPRVLLYGAAAVVLGAALAAFYILPAAYEEKWVDIAQVLSPGVRPQDNFLFTTINDADHNRFNLLVSLVATAELVVLASASFLFLKRRATRLTTRSAVMPQSPVQVHRAEGDGFSGTNARMAEGHSLSGTNARTAEGHGFNATNARMAGGHGFSRADSRTKEPAALAADEANFVTSQPASIFQRSLMVWAAVSTLLMFSFTFLAWEYLPELRFLQLPWRWLLCLNVAFALLVTMAWRHWLLRFLVCAGMLAVLVFVWHRIQPLWWDSAADIAEMQDNQQAGKGYEGADEYVPAGADASEIRQDARRISFQGGGAARIHVLQWAPESKSFTADVSQSRKLVLRLFNYPAWRVEVNGRLISAETREVTGQMLIPVQAGENRVRITFARTWDRTVGGVVSGVTAIAMCTLAVFRRKLPSIPASS